jgi:uncharacterized protein (UPF0332 family)
MTPEIKKLVEYRFARAKESLADADILYEKKSYNGAVNRFYYAAFYAAKALLAVRGLDSSKHSGVISLFQQNFVKEGVIPADIAKALSRSFEERIDMDYEDFISVDDLEVNAIRENVKDFVIACEDALKKL